MSPVEVAKVLAVIAAAYPGFEVDEIRHKTWVRMLGDLEYAVADIAVERHCKLSRFAPSIADIREQAVAALHPDRITGAESWGEFIAGIRRYGYNRQGEAFASFHPETRQVAGLIGWYDSCMAEELGVLRGQFLRMFDQLKERNNREAILTSDPRGEITDGRVLQLAASIGRQI